MSHSGGAFCKKTQRQKLNPIAIFRFLQIRASYLSTRGKCTFAQSFNLTKMFHVKLFGKTARNIALLFLVIGMIVSTPAMSTGMMMSPPPAIALSLDHGLRFAHRCEAVRTLEFDHRKAGCVFFENAAFSCRGGLAGSDCTP